MYLIKDIKNKDGKWIFIVQKRKLKRRVKVVLAMLIAVFIGVTYYNLGFAHGIKEQQKQEKIEVKSETVNNTSSESVLQNEVYLLNSYEKKTTKHVHVDTEGSSNSFVYNEKLLMPKEHQEFLYQKVVERGLDLNKVLALIKTESGFISNILSDTNDYGYFQINSQNHQELAKELGTENLPLDPYINIEWGTYFLADLYSYWQEKGVSGEKLDIAVWSSYNKGISGYKENGPATNYVNKIQTALAELNK